MDVEDGVGRALHANCRDATRQSYAVNFKVFCSSFYTCKLSIAVSRYSFSYTSFIILNPKALASRHCCGFTGLKLQGGDFGVNYAIVFITPLRTLS
jgi:hypothetical protein